MRSLTQAEKWREAQRMADLPPERVGQIMREIGRRIATVDKLKALSPTSVIADD